MLDAISSIPVYSYKTKTGYGGREKGDDDDYDIDSCEDDGDMMIIDDGHRSNGSDDNRDCIISFPP